MQVEAHFHKINRIVVLNGSNSCHPTENEECMSGDKNLISFPTDGGERFVDWKSAKGICGNNIRYFLRITCYPCTFS